MAFDGSALMGCGLGAKPSPPQGEAGSHGCSKICRRRGLRFSLPGKQNALEFRVIVHGTRPPGQMSRNRGRLPTKWPVPLTLATMTTDTAASRPETGDAVVGFLPRKEGSRPLRVAWRGHDIARNLNRRNTWRSPGTPIGRHSPRHSGKADPPGGSGLCLVRACSGLVTRGNISFWRIKYHVEYGMPMADGVLFYECRTISVQKITRCSA